MVNKNHDYEFLKILIIKILKPTYQEGKSIPPLLTQTQIISKLEETLSEQNFSSTQLYITQIRPRLMELIDEGILKRTEDDYSLTNEFSKFLTLDSWDYETPQTHELYITNYPLFSGILEQNNITDSFSREIYSIAQKYNTFCPYRESLPYVAQLENAAEEIAMYIEDHPLLPQNFNGKKLVQLLRMLFYNTQHAKEYFVDDFYSPDTIEL